MVVVVVVSCCACKPQTLSNFSLSVCIKRRIMHAHATQPDLLSGCLWCCLCSVRGALYATGIAYKGNTFGADEAQTTLATNFLGTKAVCEALAPLMPRGSRIVNVSST